MESDFKKIDLHMHTTVSDGTDTPEEILYKVRAAGLSVFSVTDHDALKAGGIIRGHLRSGDPAFIPGVEFSCKDEQGKYHILGYGYDAEHPSICGVIACGHRFRMKKVQARLDFLKSRFGFDFPEEEVRALLSLDNPGKPHIAKLMVKYGYAESLRQGISDFINLVEFKSEYVRPEEAISAILAAGGIPVLAHPFYGSGDELILGEEMDGRLRRLIGYGLLGLEAFYSGFTDKLQADALALARTYDLYTTAGSDYHGQNKQIALGDSGLSGLADCPAGLRRFLSALGIGGF